MRLGRVYLLIFLFLSVSALAQQPASSQQASLAQQASDPQAVAIVQAAISALGGATAVGQPQSWTFQAQTQGPHSNGNVDYVISMDTDTGKIVRPDGTTKPASAIHSYFVPALVGAILLKESQDPNLSMHYAGVSTQDSKPVTIIVFRVGSEGFPAQIWAFDSANLPVQIDVRLPPEIGARQSVYGLIALSNFQSVSGVLYPFRIVSFLMGRPPEIVTLQSVNASATTPPNEFNGPAGDLP
jgi:hypothetical protein